MQNQPKFKKVLKSGYIHSDKMKIKKHSNELIE
jgi:hypothetical protein